MKKETWCSTRTNLLFNAATSTSAVHAGMQGATQDVLGGHQPYPGHHTLLSLTDALGPRAAARIN